MNTHWNEFVKILIIPKTGDCEYSKAVLIEKWKQKTYSNSEYYSFYTGLKKTLIRDTTLLFTKLVFPIACRVK